MSEERKKKLKDMIKEEMEKWNLTPQDVRLFFHLISVYFLYEVEVQGKRPGDVVMEVMPLPSDVRNVGAFLTAWRRQMEIVLRDVGSAIASLMPEEVGVPRSADEMMRYMLWQVLSGRTKKREEEEEEAEEPEFEVESTEALKKSIEKVKKMLEAVRGGEKAEGSSQQGAGSS